MQPGGRLRAAFAFSCAALAQQNCSLGLGPLPGARNGRSAPGSSTPPRLLVPPGRRLPGPRLPGLGPGCRRPVPPPERERQRCGAAASPGSALPAQPALSGFTRPREKTRQPRGAKYANARSAVNNETEGCRRSNPLKTGPGCWRRASRSAGRCVRAVNGREPRRPPRRAGDAGTPRLSAGSLAAAGA